MECAVTDRKVNAAVKTATRSGIGDEHWRSWESRTGPTRDENNQKELKQ